MRAVQFGWGDPEHSGCHSTRPSRADHHRIVRPDHGTAGYVRPTVEGRDLLGNFPKLPAQFLRTIFFTVIFPVSPSMRTLLIKPGTATQGQAKFDDPRV